MCKELVARLAVCEDRLLIRRGIGRIIAEGWALRRMVASPPAGLRVLLYHTIGGSAVGDRKQLFTVKLRRFEEHLRTLLECQLSSPHRALLPLGLLDGVRDGNSEGVAVTFDDGYSDNLHLVAPLLVERQIPFTVFVTTGFLDSNSGVFLSKSELRELSALPGVTIGAHGVSHVPLTECDDELLQRELTNSKRSLEELLGMPIVSVAYPHGAVDRRVRDAARSAGYEVGACSYFDLNSPGRDPMLLARTVITGRDNSRVFRQKLLGAWDWNRLRSRDPASVDG